MVEGALWGISRRLKSHMVVEIFEPYTTGLVYDFTLICFRLFITVIYHIYEAFGYSLFVDICL